MLSVFFEISSNDIDISSILKRQELEYECSKIGIMTIGFASRLKFTAKMKLTRNFKMWLYYYI